MENTVSPVKELRERINVSQRELADALGVHHALIANLEANLINITEDDAETISKVNIIFEKLAEHSGIPKEKLIAMQAACTKQQQITVRERVIEQLSAVVEKLVGYKQIDSEDEFYAFTRELNLACQRNKDNPSPYSLRSPINYLREESGITQRQLAQAAEVSQTFIARLEAGELSLAGLNGRKLTNLIMESLNIPEYDENSDECFDPDELYEELINSHGEYMEVVAERNKEKVERAFKKLYPQKKNESGHSGNQDEEEVI